MLNLFVLLHAHFQASYVPIAAHQSGIVALLADAAVFIESNDQVGVWQTVHRMCDHEYGGLETFDGTVSTEEVAED